MHDYYLSTEIDHQIFTQISALAAQTDQKNIWPAEQLEILKQSGVFAWDLPKEFGGTPCHSTQYTKLYLDLSVACLSTAFVLSQRNAAVQRIGTCDNRELKQMYLPSLAAGTIWATVGISHLSTSRQHLSKPSVTAEETDTGYLLDGFVPWVTGVKHTDLLVTGGTLPDGRQLLTTAACPNNNIEFGEVADMLSLTSSSTGNLKLQGLEISADDVIAGPVEQVMKSGGGGTGSLTTSVITTGVARRAVLGLAEEAEKRPELKSEANQMQAECQQLVDDLLKLEENPGCDDIKLTPQSLRTRANSLVLRAAQAYLTATKGSGFLKGHPAERTIREAMFFLVWSCPAAVAQSAMKEFACSPTFLVES
ncbi:acyl-CoA dehydrogenase family protein [uncultured Rubinisphaera sp.]|uniref:acyl-CoA dehydrogenase family protein n=1 Tax=uncultured Rubinisphaera sp. TaxID=1678686 RepID=UPI0030D6F4D8